MTTQNIFIAIAGNIGTGKTTLTQMLSAHFGWDPHFEEANSNPYLADFYENMPRWSFPLQISFLTTRFQIHQKINRSGMSSMQDRSIYEDASIFARNLYEQGLMEKRDYQSYMDLYHTLRKLLNPPDLVVYLRRSLPTLKKQIASRGRDFEKNIPESYLGNLNRYYDEWIESYDLGKKLIVQSDHLDFTDRPVDFEYLTRSILESLSKTP